MLTPGLLGLSHGAVLLGTAAVALIHRHIAKLGGLSSEKNWQTSDDLLMCHS